MCKIASSFRELCAGRYGFASVVSKRQCVKFSKILAARGLKSRAKAAFAVQIAAVHNKRKTYRAKHAGLL